MGSRTLCAAVLLTLTLSPGLGAQCPAGAKVEGGGAALRVRLRPGESHRATTTMDETTTMTVMGQQQKVHQVLTAGLLFDVTAGATAGARRIRTTYESLRVALDGGRGHIEYDSAHPDSVLSAGARPYSAMVGRSIAVTLAPDGSVTSVGGVDSLIDAMVDSLRLPPGQSKAALTKMIQAQYGNRFMGETMQQVIAVLPNHPAAVGTSWTCTTTLDAPFRFTRHSVWKVRSRHAGLTTVDVKADLATDSTSTGSLASLTARYDLKGHLTGTVQIDDATGWIVQGKESGELSGTVTLEASPTSNMEMPMSVQMQSTTGPAGS